MKTHLSPNNTVNDFVKQDMQRAAVFEALGIDACCGGHKSLAEACAEKGLNAQEVLAQLQPAEEVETPPSFDAQSASAGELADHIEATHHSYLKQALPQLTALMEKVSQAHAARHPELIDLGKSFAALRADLEPHLLKEERVLFPMIRNRENPGAGTGGFPATLAAPIRVMLAEHDRTVQLQNRIRELSQNFTVPADACTSYARLMNELEVLDADLKTHIHKENDILFAGLSH